MSSKRLEIRLSPIMHAYLQDLVDIGYARKKGALARRWVENAITDALEKNVIPKRNATDFQDDEGEEDED